MQITTDVCESCYVVASIGSLPLVVTDSLFVVQRTGMLISPHTCLHQLCGFSHFRVLLIAVPHKTSGLKCGRCFA